MDIFDQTLYGRVTSKTMERHTTEVEEQLRQLTEGNTDVSESSTARAIYSSLSVLGELQLRYSARVDVWHASCAGVMVDDGTGLYHMSSPGRTPDEAIQAYWVAVTTLPGPHKVVINATRADRRRCRWSEPTRSWLFES